jgi:hypothetical protein
MQLRISGTDVIVTVEMSLLISSRVYFPPLIEPFPKIYSIITLVPKELKTIKMLLRENR